jgi:NAD(P)-dependent dehydrogenase (short-subunit alcohol dehydrogenase family)
MAKELGARGIAVNTVAPGAIETGFFGGAVRDTPEFNKLFADMTALGRVGIADDVGPMIASLLGPDNRWVNAQRTEVSGGQISDCLFFDLSAERVAGRFSRPASVRV